MPNTVTVTAYTGPEKLVTALVLNNVVDVRFDLAEMVLFVKQSDSVTIKEYDLVGIATVTFSISGNTYTIVVS